MSESAHIFNRTRVRKHRDRAAVNFPRHDFLIKEMGLRLADRLEDIGRDFSLALDLGAHTGLLAGLLPHVGRVVQSDLSFAMIARANGPKLVADEEFLPFADDAFDLVVSAGSLHWVNDLPGALIQINRTLKSGGLLIAVMPGGETLKELRESFEHAEMQMKGGLSPRISPFIDVRDAGGLLQRAGFAEPVCDSEILTVTYEHPLKLLHDLRGMGEANALASAVTGFTTCSLIMAMSDYYLRRFSDEKGRIPATFELVTMTAWKSRRAPL